MSLAGLETSLGYAIIGRQAGRFVAADPDAMPGAEPVNALGDSENGPLPPEMQPGFAVGTEVHDFLSGLDGVVVESPVGITTTDIAFVRFADDAETHPIRVDQLEMKQAAIPPEIPGPDLSDLGLHSGEETTLAGGPAPKAALAPVVAPAPEPIKAGEKSGLDATTVVGDGIAGSGSGQTYGQVFEAAGPRITAAKLLEYFGYVPKQWDRVIAALEADGVKVLRVRGEADIMAKAALGLNEKEIVTEICAAFGAVQAETVAKLETLKTQASVARRQDAARKLNLEALQAGMPKDPVPAGMIYAKDETKNNWYLRKVEAGIPSKPQPDNPPAGMIYAWDDQKQDWYLQKLSDNQESVVV